jgi:hypothetical protein
MQSTGQIDQLGESSAQVSHQALELLSHLLGLVAGGCESLQVPRHRHEPLLRTIVKIALDLATGSVRGLHDARA